ncbi:sulfur carrier protein ThiS [Aliikangiella coralliicola]|uniref:Sulfur carrier protein ThiS n=1 Tax=Aliikangiella coralliicola TaxID=2592383 RepID=A0A545UI12_9GAMM|nr:sulfur carrier protein ThiS [Aliikangiella coralliicola]TQV89107.1 sulfur carrier protein ThiS [Aliikangiella coralliicola]
MIKLWLNGEQITSEALNLKVFLKEHYNDSASFAVAVNEYFVPKFDYENIELREGDRVEMVVPMAGG